MPEGDSTFVFADIAGFTALTEVHGDEHAADLMTAFAEDVRSRLADGSGELVKSIGDALMLRLGSAGEAVELGRDLANSMAARHGYPGVRVGINRGPAVRRGEDWFGTTVNVAARVAAVAAAGDVLLTEAVRAALPQEQRDSLDDRGPFNLKNVSQPVRIYAFPPDSDASAVRVTDPVCQMNLDRTAATGMLRHGGRTFHFCSLECARRFAAHPERYHDVASRQ